MKLPRQSHHPFNMRIMVLILLLLMGCAPLPRSFHYVSRTPYMVDPVVEHQVWIDKNFGGMDHLFIDDAIRQWNYALNGRVRIMVMGTFDMEPEIISKVVSGSGWVIMRVDGSNPLVVDSKTLAWVNSVGGNRMWIIRERLSNPMVLGVVMHEIGHLLGAEHDNIYLMSPYYQWENTRCIDYATIKLVARARKIPVKELNYCIYH